MHHERIQGLNTLPPCLVDKGVLINKADMLRLLQDLGQVSYSHLEDGVVVATGQGLVMEVFSDSQQATLVANHTLYINVHSFDYLEMGRVDSDKSQFDLVRDNRRLRLVPLSDPIKDHLSHTVNTVALEAMVADALSASWDACLDDDRNFFE
ncbi:MAG: hypothetical protein KGQ93_05090 [Cyanobacteria bacterium REEB459]|nr:hypothetical protein [Cyanobacteria bacterium REEB459]